MSLYIEITRSRSPSLQLVYTPLIKSMRATHDILIKQLKNHQEKDKYSYLHKEGQLFLLKLLQVLEKEQVVKEKSRVWELLQSPTK